MSAHASICAEAKETEDYKEYVILQAQFQQTTSLYVEARREREEILRQMEQLEVRREENRVNLHRLSKIYNIQEENFAQIRDSVATCEKGDNCPFYIPLAGERKGDISVLVPDYERICHFFHTKAQIAAFEIRERERVEALNEKRRLQREAQAAQKEAKEYQYTYCLLGTRIKEALQIPDEICTVIRSYCASRSFPRGPPAMHWETTLRATKPCPLKQCKQCSDQLFCKQYTISCSFCACVMDNEKAFYALVKNHPTKTEAHFLHKECAHLLGMKSDDDSTLLRDDTRDYREVVCENIQLIHNPRICLISYHAKSIEPAF